MRDRCVYPSRPSLRRPQTSCTSPHAADDYATVGFSSGTDGMELRSYQQVGSLGPEPLERCDNGGTKLRPGVYPQLRERLAGLVGAAVWAMAGERIPGIGDGDDPSRHRHRVTFQAVR